MQCYTKTTLENAFPTEIWQYIASEIIAYTSESIRIPQYCSLQEYDSLFPQGLAHYKQCVILYSKQEYTLHIDSNTHHILKPYSQENDTIYYDHLLPKHIEHIQANMFCLIPTKTIYTIIPHNENMTITAFFLPQYIIMQGDATVEIQCFSMLQSFMPINATTYPVFSTWTLHDVIDSLGIEDDVVRIVFVDNTAMRKETPVIPNTKITLFPGIGGG